MIKTADQALAVLDIAKALFAETLLLVYLPDRRSPAAFSVLAYARDGYLGLIDDDWESHQSEASQTAIHLEQRVMERLQ
ncbi:hypothetical protein [Rhizobium grahamii]|uniref:Uncharacterized protein n=1 Tax=Rhizobium grahamii TaxID=1120045 RepID=A0A370KP38_9HYPH|nr:hypothetical protein [Rhizobium grahamii]RDJ11121.1 hypothetical protein B5K06_12475 [Rhizobium grahamii]